MRLVARMTGLGLIGLTGHQIYFSRKKQQFAEKTKDIFQKALANDRDKYRNSNFNVTASTELNSVESTRSFKQVLPELVEEERAKGKHMMTLKFSPEQTGSLSPVALSHGFKFHHANPSYSLLTKCLEEHADNECSYPKYRTTGLGVTAVVFNETFKKVLVVKERSGNVVDRFKPPTGRMEEGETPHEAVLRELCEETGLQLTQVKVVGLSSHYFGHDLQGRSDINFSFAIVVPEDAPLQPQKREIKQIEWMELDKYLSSKVGDKPWIMHDMVADAKAALEKQTTLQPKTSHYSYGKPIVHYSTSVKK